MTCALPGGPFAAASRVEAEVAGLEMLGLSALRTSWKARFGAQPPPLRSPELLRLLLAWRLQAAVSGGLDRETRRRLAARGALAPEGRHLGLGAILRRDWQGRRVEVVVETEGFRWEGSLYPSLSAVARAVTGARWNGPRFFGLREDKGG